MRKKILVVTAAFILAPAVLFAGAAPVAAHGGHTSCAGGVVGVLAEEYPEFDGLLGPGPSGKGPSGGELSALAKAGPQGASGGVALAHLLFCAAS